MADYILQAGNGVTIAYRWDEERSRLVVEDNLDGHDREVIVTTLRVAADRIRSKQMEREGSMFTSTHGEGVCDGLKWAADIIDPDQEE